jgi:hypothetical protein
MNVNDFCGANDAGSKEKNQNSPAVILRKL